MAVLAPSCSSDSEQQRAISPQAGSQRRVRVGALIDSPSVGRKEEFALSCQTPCWIEAYTTMGRVEYTCSLLLGKMLILLQAAETRGRIKSFWVHSISLLFGVLVWLSAHICLCVALLSSHPAVQTCDAPALNEYLSGKSARSVTRRSHAQGSMCTDDQSDTNNAVKALFGLSARYG